MSKHSFPFYKEQLEMILAVTKMLNEHSGDIPIDPHYYFKIQLVDSHEEDVIGEWSDEVGPDCWEFSLTEKEAKKPEIIVNQSFQLPQSNIPGARGTTATGVPVQFGPDMEEVDRIARYAANNKNVQLD